MDKLLMPLPIAKAADLAKSMAKGVGVSMGEPKDMSDDVPDHIKPVLDDIDALVPGLGKLMMELCEKMKEDDSYQDKEDMEE
jgi:hypothetical protein